MTPRQASLGLRTIMKRLLWLLPGPIFYGLFRLAFLSPAFTEHFYSRTVFPAINQVLSTVTGVFPFSLAELLLYMLVLAVIVFLGLITVRAVRAQKNWWRPVVNGIITLLSVISILYALFVGLWGFNYARQPLSKSLELDASPATTVELRNTCAALILQANALREHVPEDGDGVFAPAMTRREIMDGIPNHYNNAAALTGYSFLGGSYGRVKPVLYSEGLSWAHIAGIYIPFTGEANVNANAPMLLFASSAAHEAAHQRGFAREDEANFLAYYVLSLSDDVSTRYSGTMLALIHAMNALYRADSDMYFKLRQSYSEGVNRDLAANSAYWQRYEGEVSEAVTEVNNTYLKANMQTDGVQSYGRMVDLLIGLWRNGGITE